MTETLSLSFLIACYNRKTFSLGNQEHFNQKNGFNKTELEFTYLVPSDQAWEEVRKEYASAYKVTPSLCITLMFIVLFQILFMGEFYYQTHHVLERHLKVGAKMSLEDMVIARSS